MVVVVVVVVVVVPFLATSIHHCSAASLPSAPQLAAERVITRRPRERAIRWWILSNYK